MTLPTVWEETGLPRLPSAGTCRWAGPWQVKQVLLGSAGPRPALLLWPQTLPSLMSRKHPGPCEGLPSFRDLHSLWALLVGPGRPLRSAFRSLGRGRALSLALVPSLPLLGPGCPLPVGCAGPVSCPREGCHCSSLPRFAPNPLTLHVSSPRAVQKVGWSRKPGQGAPGSGGPRFHVVVPTQSCRAIHFHF